jgi:CRISPR-associated endonuclease Cas1
MQNHPSRPRRTRRNGVVYCASGYGIRVRVERGHLVVDDGIGADRRVARFNRATSGLRRLVVVASTGYVSFEALRWLTDTGAALIHLDHAGNVVATSHSGGGDHPALRRAQALAASRPVGIEISRRLLRAKLDGQRDVVALLDADAASHLSSLRATVGTVSELAGLRLAEAQAAQVYWAAWRGVKPRFATKDVHRIPQHWHRFSRRVSPLTGGPRTAADPINAILNYLYGLLEAESRIALEALGLDAGLGILHTDQRSRASLACDVMEPIRPVVDRHVHDLLGSRPLSRHDLVESSQGQCRLLPRLTVELAGTLTTWRRHVAPHAEMIASLLATDAGLPQPATLLTGETRRTARPSSDKTRPPRIQRPTVAAAACADCGASIRPAQNRCRSCHQVVNDERMRSQQADHVGHRRLTGEHPSGRRDVRKRIAESQRAQWAARKASAAGGGFTGRPSEFRRLVLPRLAGIESAALAEATGLSVGYCSQIRQGRRVPHVRHWAALQLLGLNHPDA